MDPNLRMGFDQEDTMTKFEENVGKLMNAVRESPGILIQALSGLSINTLSNTACVSAGTPAYDKFDKYTAREIDHYTEKLGCELSKKRGDKARKACAKMSDHLQLLNDINTAKASGKHAVRKRVRNRVRNLLHRD